MKYYYISSHYMKVRKGIYDDYPDYYDNVPEGSSNFVIHEVTMFINHGSKMTTRLSASTQPVLLKPKARKLSIMGFLKVTRSSSVVVQFGMAAMQSSCSFTLAA